MGWLYPWSKGHVTCQAALFIQIDHMKVKGGVINWLILGIISNEHCNMEGATYIEILGLYTPDLWWFFGFSNSILEIQ